MTQDNTNTLLIEILVEELPAIPFLKEKNNILPKWQEVLKKYNLSGNAKMFYTPRRIVLIDKEMPLKSKDEEIISYGPPISIAYNNGDKNLGLSQVGEAFYKKNNLPLDTIGESVIKDNKEVLYVKNIKHGVNTKDVIGEMVTEWTESLNFGKSMFWGSNNIAKHKFIRPIRNVCVLLDNQEIIFDIFDIQSKAQTTLHRDMGFDYHRVVDIDSYLDLLAQNKIILDENVRREKILNDIKNIESTHDIKVEIDESLLEEIVAITEYPTALYGQFDKSFLKIPQEVIITSMKENQRYFAVFKNQTLHNGFVVISNGGEDKIVTHGNEKVLHARLSDAVFFYDNDIKNRWDNAIIDEKLGNIVFIENLGTLKDKKYREIKILNLLSKKYNFELKQSDIDMVGHFAKADLLSSVVGEFPKLQGVIGGYLAKAFGLGDEVATAINEQYLPLGEDSALPTSKLGILLALSIKIDNILSLFSINKIPTGSKDPFALRRSAVGIIKIVMANKLSFDISSDIESICKNVGYQNIDIKQIDKFFTERLESILGLNPSIFRCAINGNAKREIIDISTRANLINEVYATNNDITSIFKRVANILKDFDSVNLSLNPDLFNTDEEKALYKALNDVDKTNISLKYANALFELKKPLGEFFDKVLINDENPNIANNRKMLCYAIYKEFLTLGDIKELIQ